MVEQRVPAGKLTSLFHAEIYIAGVNVDGHAGRICEVISREPGKIDGYLLGELESVQIFGTVFADPEKRALWDRFHSGELSWNELKSRGGDEDFDPTPQGDYLAVVGGYHRRKGLIGDFAHKYDLRRNEISGDEYRMFMFLKEDLTEKVRTTISTIFPYSKPAKR